MKGNALGKAQAIFDLCRKLKQVGVNTLIISNS